MFVIPYLIVIFLGAPESDEFVLLKQMSRDPESSVLPVFQHRPIYGILGKNDSKISFSFKGKFVESFDLYVGYSQLMMWNIYKHSAPLRDVNYNPELFYRYTFGTDQARWIDIGFYEHESNGFDDTTSRSWDRSYLRYHGNFAISDYWHFLWNLKVWWAYHKDKWSNDLMKYRGAWELDFTLKNLMSWIFEADEINMRIFPGGRYYTNPIEGGQELTLRGKIRAKNFLPYLVIQLFHGYGENLLDYKRDHFEVRAGLGY